MIFLIIVSSTLLGFYIKNQLKDFEIIVYSAPESVQIQVDILRNKDKIDIKTLC